MAWCTFTGNTATTNGLGGAIDSGDSGGGSVTVTASTFTSNIAPEGGAIASGAQGGGGSVSVTASTFTSNSADGAGGAIDSGDSGFGSVTVTASTFSGNGASAGGAIDSGDDHGGGSVQVAGDVFDGSCDQPGFGSWADGGYNAGSDGSCFGSPVPPTDVQSASLGLGSLADDGGPTQTIVALAGSPVTGIIPDPTTVTLGGGPVALCPAADQRGYPSAGGTACDAGAVQTSGSAPALTLQDSATPASFNAAGQLISFSYMVSNTGAGPLTGIGVTDPAVPAVSCPAPVLAAGTSETCTGTYTVTSADLAAGTITGTAVATGATSNGVPVASNPATVTVAEGWPPAVTGSNRPAGGAAEGYYLGVVNNTWQLLVTHPGTSKVSFTGHLSVPAGTLGHLTLINPTARHQVSTTGKTITFTLPNYGKVTGFASPPPPR